MILFRLRHAVNVHKIEECHVGRNVAMGDFSFRGATGEFENTQPYRYVIYPTV